jgi:hypothetical protein
MAATNKVKSAPDSPGPPIPTSHPVGQDEYDRRGIKLPARARVGGIITPQ